MEPKCVLVTGGAGFIGSHLCDVLLSAGHRVVVVDNLSLGRLENVAHLEGEERFGFHEFDILDREAMQSLYAREAFQAVFHMAANSDIAQSHKNPAIDLDNTFRTTYAVLEMMRSYGIDDLVFASSSAVYGEASGLLSETDGPLLPVSHYGASKLAGEAFVSSFVANYGLKAWIVRFPNVTGPRSTHGVVHDFVHKLRKNPETLQVLGDGRQVKPYLHVDDLVGAMMFVWANARESLNLYNIGVDNRIDVTSIARIVVEEMGLNAAIEYTGGARGWIGDVPSYEYDLSRIHQLGWQASMDSAEAIRRAARAVAVTQVQ